MKVDKEKLIRTMEYCTADITPVDENDECLGDVCPFKEGGYESGDCQENMIRAALALLKEQEPRDGAEREKVIRGLEACVHNQHLMQCESCPYHTDKARCLTTLMRDALDLLREQEARVMDEDEVFVTELSTVLYLERRRARETTRIVPAILTDHDTWSYGQLSSYRYAEFVYEGKLIDHRDLATYGVTWRCWTSRPTPEQMRDTKWEEL